MGRGDEPSYDPLLWGNSPFVAEGRRVQNKLATIVFSVLYGGVFLGSFCAYHNANPKFFELDDKFLNDPANCPIDTSHRRLLEAHDQPRFDASDFASHAVAWLIISILASTAIAAAFLHLVRHHAHSLARLTIGFQMAVPATAATMFLLSGSFGPALLSGAFAALTFAVFYMWRREIGVASTLLSVAGHGLAANANLIGMTIALNIGSVFFVLPPLVGAILGFSVGDVVPNPMRENREACVDEFGVGVTCCAWQPRTGAMVYIGLAGLVAGWTMLALNQIWVYTVSGTVAQWYFSPPGTSVTGNAARSFKHAITTSLGTNIFAGLILTITNLIKQQQQQDQQNGNFSFFGFIASCLASLYEYLTKFATVFAAISGDDLLTAGRRVTDLLMRSMLEAFATTVWFPSAVMSLASVTLSALWGGAVWASYRYLHHPGGVEEKYPQSNAIVLGVLVGVVTFFVLSFLMNVLLSVLDSVFVCFAIDKDRQTVANAEMYEALLGAMEKRESDSGRGVGVVFEGPDGGLGYGRA
ncbi:putative CTL-like protein [Nannochloris sp. 'desiccata']|nr:putative CTL-like protein [Chlorella desiccata (nom. nud.)]